MSSSLAFIPNILPCRLMRSQVVRHVTTSSATSISRRAAVRLFALVIPAALLPITPARSESTYEKKVRSSITVVAAGLQRATALKNTVSQWSAQLTEDDMLYILRYIPIWLDTAQVEIAKTAAQDNVDVGDRNVLSIKSGEMLGHLLELRQEAKIGKRDGVLRELDEITETFEEFLALPGIKRFTSK